MTSGIDDFGDIIDLWPKPSAQLFAEDLSVGKDQVHMWRWRARESGAIIAACHWNKIIAAARSRKIAGVSLEVFARLAEQALKR